MKIRSTFFTLVGLLLLSPPLFALEPVSILQGESVLRWCASAEEAVYYTNLNVTPKARTRCGALEMLAYCDGLGNKYIGPNDGVPYGYRDCSLGPSIYIERDGTSVDIPAALRAFEIARNGPRSEAVETEPNDSNDLLESIKGIAQLLQGTGLLPAFGAEGSNSNTPTRRSVEQSNSLDDVEQVIRILGILTEMFGSD